MGFFSSKVPRDNHQVTPPFTTCIVKVDTQSNWQKTVSKVLKKCHVNSFRMDQSGMVEISGVVDPSTLLRMLERAGRSAELTWYQFGECSSNLFMPTTNTNNYYPPSRDGRYLQPPGNLSRPSPYTNQNQVYDHHNNSYDYGYNESGYNGYNSYGAIQYLDYK